MWNLNKLIKPIDKGDFVLFAIGFLSAHFFGVKHACATKCFHKITSVKFWFDVGKRQQVDWTEE